MQYLNFLKEIDSAERVGSKYDAVVLHSGNT
jgi:hypothetical protein